MDDRNDLLDAKRVFDQVTELPRDQRKLFLERVCADRFAIRAYVEQMLEQFEGDVAFEINLRSPSSALHPLTADTEFSGTPRFTIQRRLGSGAFGVVYSVWDRDQEAAVALKVLRNWNPGSLFRFKQEFRSLAGLRHPNLVRFHELFSEDGVWFFTMELVEGSGFLEYARPRHLIPGDTPDGTQLVILKDAFVQLANGLEALHKSNRVHRDLKPENVRVTREGRVMLLDFGMIAELDDQGLHASDTGNILGTYQYMSPEQAKGEPVSRATDWYSFGVMLFQSLTGQLPFQGSLIDVVRAKQAMPPPQPTGIASAVPKELDVLCAGLLEPEPGDRLPPREIFRQLQSGERHVSTVPDAARPGGLFVGRQGELDILRTAYADSQRGRTVLVRVSGRSGIGKSALLRQFVNTLRLETNAIVLEGQCYEQESVPFKALDSLIDALARHLKQLGHREARAYVPSHFDALKRIFPVLGEVGAPTRLHAEPQIFDAVELRRRAFASFRDLLMRIGDLHPLVLILDDLQWGDLDSAQLICEVLRNPDTPRLLLVTSFRDEEASTNPFLRRLIVDLRNDPLCLNQIDLTVKELSLGEAASLAETLLDESIHDKHLVATRIAQESDGNTLFVYELARASERWDDPISDVGQTDALLASTIWHRVCELPVSARRILEIVAVAGRPLSGSTVFEAANVARDEQDIITLLLLGRLLRTVATGSHFHLETYHDKIRETILCFLSDDTRRGHHRALAATLALNSQTDSEQLAYHWMEAGAVLQAGEMYALAASQAFESLAFDQAARLFRLAITLLQAPQTRECLLRSQLAESLVNVGRCYDAAIEYVTAAGMTSGAHALDLRQRAVKNYFFSGHIDEGLAVVRDVLTAFGMTFPSTQRRAFLTLILALTQLWLRGTHFVARDSEQLPAEELARIDICWSAGLGLCFEDPIRAASFIARSILLALRTGEPYRVARGLTLTGLLGSMGRGAKRRARRFEFAKSVAQKSGDPYLLALISMIAGELAFVEGSWKTAAVQCQQAERIFREQCTGALAELGISSIFHLEALYFLGNVIELKHRLPVLIKQGEDRGDLFLVTSLGVSLQPFIQLVADDPAAAERGLADNIGRWSRQSVHLQHTLAVQSRLWIDLYNGDGALAWKRITEYWPDLKRSLTLRMVFFRISMLHLRACSALAAAARVSNPKPLLRAAERDARRLESDRVPWATAFAGLIRAGIAVRRGNEKTAISLLTDASAQLEALEMLLWTLATRRRLGVLIGGSTGRNLIEESDRAMIAQTVRNPSRMTDLLAPGFSSD